MPPSTTKAAAITAPAIDPAGQNRVARTPGDVGEGCPGFIVRPAFDDRFGDFLGQSAIKLHVEKLRRAARIALARADHRHRLSVRKPVERLVAARVPCEALRFAAGDVDHEDIVVAIVAGGDAIWEASSGVQTGITQSSARVSL